MNTIAYVYKWTHIPTLKWYVGSRTAKGCHPDDGYICTSSLVKPLIKSNPNEWLRTIIATGTKEQMLELEGMILTLFDAMNDPTSFNRHNNNGKFHVTPDSVKKMLITRKKNGFTAWNKGICHLSDDARRSISEKTKKRFEDPAQRAMVSKAQKGKTISQEHRDAISKKNTGIKRGPQSEAHKQKLRERDNYWTKGENSWWAKLEHKPTVSCLKCRREVGFNILGKHQWGSRCKATSKASK